MLMRIAAMAVVAMVMIAAPCAHAEPRVALVIGNAAYTSPGWRLANPTNDASLISRRLQDLGFAVDTVLNADKAGMERAMGRFVSRVRTAGPDAVGVFYYAGHGVESDGANLLVPVDANASSVDELRYQAPPLQFVLRDLARAGNPVNIVILDACRNLPLPSGTRSGPAGGLAALDDVPTNVLIAYATRAGLTAPDNPGQPNSVFTRTLADALAKDADQTLVNMLSNVQSKVFVETGSLQRPEFRSGLLRAPNFRLATSVTAGDGARAATGPPVPTASPTPTFAPLPAISYATETYDTRSWTPPQRQVPAARQADLTDLTRRLRSDSPSIRLEAATFASASFDTARQAVLLTEGATTTDPAVADVAARLAFQLANHSFLPAPTEPMTATEENSYAYLMGMNFGLKLGARFYNPSSGAYEAGGVPPVSRGTISGARIQFSSIGCNGRLDRRAGSWTYEGLVRCAYNEHRFAKRMEVTLR